MGLVLNGFVEILADDDYLVRTEVSELMHGDHQKCMKGDVIMPNPMMAAFLCDLSMPSIAGAVVCRYLGKKRLLRAPKK